MCLRPPKVSRTLAKIHCPVAELSCCNVPIRSNPRRARPAVTPLTKLRRGVWKPPPKRIIFRGARLGRRPALRLFRPQLERVEWPHQHDCRLSGRCSIDFAGRRNRRNLALDRWRRELALVQPGTAARRRDIADRAGLRFDSGRNVWARSL